MVKPFIPLVLCGWGNIQEYIKPLERTSALRGPPPASQDLWE